MNIKGIFRKPERFTNYDPDSPAERAARKWDEREGEIVVQNQNLRLLLAGMMVVAICLTGGLVYKSMASAVMPYVVEVDTTTGAVRNIGTVAASAEYTPGEAVYKYFLARWCTRKILPRLTGISPRMLPRSSRPCSARNAPRKSSAIRRYRSMFPPSCPWREATPIRSAGQRKNSSLAQGKRPSPLTAAFLPCRPFGARTRNSLPSIPSAFTSRISLGQRMLQH